MAKMWAGRTTGDTDRIADDFNSSIHFDSRMYRQDITGSMEHATMLATCGILTKKESRWHSDSRNINPGKNTEHY